MEYARGELTQKAELASKASLSQQDIDKISGTTTGGSNKETSSEQSRQRTITPELSFSMSETFVNALKDSIEARTAGILQDGQAFFADFRSIKSKRIGGTYNFDLMLEVPAEVEAASEGSTLYASNPCVDEIRADVYMVAVVRHVYERGFTGWLTKVPEPDNDKTYYQVVTEYLPDVLLWKFGGVPWVKTQTVRSNEFVVSVTTNRNDARYIVKAVDGTERVLANGSGSISRLNIPPQSTDVEAYVEFLDVIETVSDHVHIFSAPKSSTFTIKKDTGGEQSIVGNYGPKKYW